MKKFVQSANRKAILNQKKIRFDVTLYSNGGTKMIKKNFLLLLTILFLISFSVNVNAVSEGVLSFIEEWNTNVDMLANQWSENSERDQNLAKKLYLSEKILNNSIDSHDNYYIDFFDNPVQLKMSYDESDNTLMATVWNLQKNKYKFLKNNYETAHIAEVLIHTVENQNNAERLVNELRIYDFWSNQGLENIAAYDLLEFDQMGAFHFMILDDFYIGFDIVNDDFAHGFDISYNGSWKY
ncbi:MAG: hypothetical protein D5S01_03905 [Halanaerobium sp. MSAO_Bac5]|nr:MAG: hypothetical protein D5S01_03905 [Halanaerobium sp. MSAO_Bac5]